MQQVESKVRISVKKETSTIDNAQSITVAITVCNHKENLYDTELSSIKVATLHRLAFDDSFPLLNPGTM